MGAIRKHWHRLCFLAAPFLLLSLAGLMSPPAMAQQATATINGVVKDPTGAAIPNAQVELTNVNTAVVRTTSTNSDGVYAFPSVVPGVYTMQVSATGFTTVTQPPDNPPSEPDRDVRFSTEGRHSAAERYRERREGAALETATSELGTVVNTKEVNDLPLNGRNFTQLLTDHGGCGKHQSRPERGGGGGWTGNSLGSSPSRQ